MNIHRHRIITGGKNGKIHIYSLHTGQILYTLSIPRSYLPSLNTHACLNVALWNNRLAYGVYDATFFVCELEDPKEGGGGTGTGRVVCKLKDEEVGRHGFTYAPMTMVMGEWFLVANGGFPDELSLWDLRGLGAEASGLSGRDGKGLKRMGRSSSDLRSESDGGSSGSSSAPDGNGITPGTTTTPTNTTPKFSTHSRSRSRLRRYALSETYALQKEGFAVPPFRDLQSAEIMNDG
ncbi:hypothetical protein HK097_006717, partial [Rhizophlyctis rosea]